MPEVKAIDVDCEDVLMVGSPGSGAGTDDGSGEGND